MSSSPGYQNLLDEGVARGFPAMALWVRRGDEAPWSGAAGLASLEDKEPVSTAHAFHLASVTKLFTTVALRRPTAEDLARLGDAAFRGDLLAEKSRRWLLATAEGLADEPVGSERQAALYAYHKPYGVLLTAEGDGPGGSHTLLAYHPESDTLVVALVNIFGLGGEADFLVDVVGSVVAAEETGTSPPEK